MIFIAILRISPYSNYDPIRSLKTVLKTVCKTIDKNVYYWILLFHVSLTSIVKGLQSYCSTTNYTVFQLMPQKMAFDILYYDALIALSLLDDVTLLRPELSAGRRKNSDLVVPFCHKLHSIHMFCRWCTGRERRTYRVDMSGELA